MDLHDAIKTRDKLSKLTNGTSSMSIGQLVETLQDAEAILKGFERREAAEMSAEFRRHIDTFVMDALPHLLMLLDMSLTVGQDPTLAMLSLVVERQRKQWDMAGNDLSVEMMEALIDVEDVARHAMSLQNEGVF